MVIYVYDEKKGLLNLTQATTVEYYGKSPRRSGLATGGTMLILSYPDGSRYLVYGITLNDLQLMISQGKDRTILRKWEKIGSLPDVSLDFM
ncbi:hypothetical protein ACUUL3_04040 [Thiovibrio sp. JS02]